MHELPPEATLATYKTIIDSVLPAIMTSADEQMNSAVSRKIAPNVLPIRRMRQKPNTIIVEPSPLKQVAPTKNAFNSTKATEQQRPNKNWASDFEGNTVKSKKQKPDSNWYEDFADSKGDKTVTSNTDWHAENQLAHSTHGTQASVEKTFWDDDFGSVETKSADQEKKNDWKNDF